MKHYKSTNNEIYAYEADGSQDAYIPKHLIAITDAEANAIRNPPPTEAEIIAQFERAIQSMLDAEAQAKGYDNITTACSYAGAPNPFELEAKSFISWRGNVWAYCYGELAKVQNGTRAMPTIEQIVGELPSRV